MPFYFNIHINIIFSLTVSNYIGIITVIKGANTMKKISLKVISVIMVITLLCSLFAVSAVAAKTVD